MNLKSSSNQDGPSKQARTSDTATSVMLVSTDGKLAATFAASFSDASRITVSLAQTLADAGVLLRQKTVEVLLFEVSGPQDAWLSSLERFCVSHPRLRLLVLTDRVDRCDLFGTLMVGAAGYLVKSDMVGEALLNAILRAKAGSSVMSSSAMKVLTTAYKSFRRVQIRSAVFTARELEITGCLLSGFSDKEIASCLNCSTKTISVHLEHVYKKLGVHNRRDAMVRLVDLLGENSPN